ncbi:MAG: NYN domain-containing protein [Candidatus Yanofskybacteria bacterium]|nr:NYN domain-containing protein [Candidatus Yanofskybacteria bacterium]
MSDFKKLLLRGKAVAFVDWANVHGWGKNLKKSVDAGAIFSYLSGYAEVKNTRLYFGTDKHEKSVEFLKVAEKKGYEVVTKPVKYILAGEVGEQKIYVRKCDFDMEVCIDVHRLLKDSFESFIFFTGDGDYAPLYQMLIGLRKQVIVVYASGHLGREVWDIKRGLFKAQLRNLMDI